MIYFDNAATGGKKPDEVIRAVTNTLKHLSANAGRSGHRLASSLSRLIYNARERTAGFFNAETSRVIFTSGATESLNMAILGTLRRGGHIITTVYEHNSVLRVLNRLEKDGLIKYSVVKPKRGQEAISAEDILKAMTDKTYLAAVNHISNVNGAENNVKEIGGILKNKGVLFLVDGAQSAGHKKIDIKNDNIGMLCIAGHKGMCAPQGIGALILNENVSLKPIKFGGTGTGGDIEQPLEYPDGFESGTLNSPAIAGLLAALKFLEQNKGETQTKTERLTAKILLGLGAIKNIKIYTPKAALNGIISFNVKGLSSGEVSDILDEKFEIAVRSGLHCAPLMHRYLRTYPLGTVRASLGFQNSEAEADKFLSAVKEIAER